MQEEIYDTRDPTYSKWHRRKSTQRFVGIELAQTLAMIDVDATLWLEYDDDSKEPLAIVETAKDCGQSYKNGTVTRNFAKRCTGKMPAFILLYTPSEHQNPAAPEVKDISQFRYKRIWPEPVSDWKVVTPKEWADILVQIRMWSARQVDEMQLPRETLGPHLAVFLE